MILTAVSLYVALPSVLPLHFGVGKLRVDRDVTIPPIQGTFLGHHFYKEFTLKEGLDIQGGMEVVLRAKMDQIPANDRPTALESAKGVIERRVDLFGISEPLVQTSQVGNEYRLLVDLPGVADPNQALQLVGATAQLEFKLQATDSGAFTNLTSNGTLDASASSVSLFNQFQSTGLTGKQLQRATVQFDPKTGEPVIGLQFNDDGRKIFADVTTKHVGSVLAIFLDDYPVVMPRINTPIVDGQAVMTGGFTVAEAKQLAIQLNAGALPVPIEIIEQRQLGASIGQDAVAKSIRAGLVGIGLVMLFMVLIYGWKGVLADFALIVYGIVTFAVYKVFGVTLTLPGIAGLLLSVGMAVDANILIFERIKEELRLGKPFERAMELGFGRAWESIKDANVTTILTALILINPFDFNFLNTSGLVRGFGITLLIGVIIGLFTGIIVTRTFVRLFLADPGGNV